MIIEWEFKIECEKEVDVYEKEMNLSNRLGDRNHDDKVHNDKKEVDIIEKSNSFL